MFLILGIPIKNRVFTVHSNYCGWVYIFKKIEIYVLVWFEVRIEKDVEMSLWFTVYVSRKNHTFEIYNNTKIKNKRL